MFEYVEMSSQVKNKLSYPPGYTFSVRMSELRTLLFIGTTVGPIFLHNYAAKSEM